MNIHDDREPWLERLRLVRGRSLDLVAPLSVEDMAAQAMPDASPSKWHLAHTTWFFETFLLGPAALSPGTAPRDWGYLYNSYYDSLGSRHPRIQRGLLTRPSATEILAWRHDVDERLQWFCANADTATFARLADALELGLHHEEQHQELLLTDVLALFAMHPWSPAYQFDHFPEPTQVARPLSWLPVPRGLQALGAAAAGFAFDCERPRHPVWLQPAELADRLVTQGEWLEFLESGGYREPRHWLAEGWAWVQAEGIVAPGYWQEDPHTGWTRMTLQGRRPLNLAAPVCHVSFWEAEAYARFAGARLPTEAEWEAIAETAPRTGNLYDTGALRPLPALNGAHQFFGDVWEWTASSFSPYPGFRTGPGAVGEYNGKFMAQQMVLRGGSCATPSAHIRPSYRNFFYPGQRWQFMGLRLARDAA